MLGGSKVFATIAVHDMENAEDFYVNILGLKKVEKNMAGIVFESGGANIAIYPSPTAGSGQATCAWWRVDDVEATVKDLKEKGVKFEYYDDMPGAIRHGDIYVISEMKAAWFKDPDGNILGIGNI
jgi:catechol 2,3-dioxygenase-like lactoylglutathione lyase family enzyme